MNRQEIQYSLDRRGYIDIDKDSTIDAPIELGHLTGKVHIVSSNYSRLTFDSISGRHLFEYRYLDSYTHDPPEIFIAGVGHSNSATYSGFFRVREAGNCPARLHIDDCTMQAASNYAIDCPSGGDMECLVVERCSFNTGGAIRWHSTSTAYPDFVHIKTNRYNGSPKPGSTFNFKNVQNLTMQLNTLDGSVEILDALKNNFAGPIAIQIINPIGRCVVDDFWFEPWSNWNTTAPDCWGFTVRTDDTTGNYGQRVFTCHNVALNADGLGTGIKLNEFMGGHSEVNAASMLVYLQDQWKAADVDYNFGGKIRVLMERAADNDNMDDDIETSIDGFIASSYRDPLRMAPFNLPYNNFAAGGTNYLYPSETDLDDAWIATAAEYDA